MSNIKFILGIPITVLLIVMVPFTFWTDRNLDYLFTVIKHTPTDIPLWFSFVVSFFGNGITFIFNIIMEFYRFI